MSLIVVSVVANNVIAQYGGVSIIPDGVNVTASDDEMTLTFRADLRDRWCVGDQLDAQVERST